jgi:Lysozyme inhibitor LprI
MYFERTAMKLSALCAIVSLLAGAATAQQAQPTIRVIAPDRFQPNALGDYGAHATPVVATAPSAEHPLGSCEKAARTWLTCLRSTADLSDAEVAKTQNRILAALDNRPGMNEPTKRGLAKALADADTKWRALREQECGELALLETGAGALLYEAKLVCQIRRDAERVNQLSARYDASPAKAVGSAQAP